MFKPTTLMVLFSAIFRSNIGVLLGVSGTVLVAYVGGLFPQIKLYMPTMLMDASSLLTEALRVDSYVKAVVLTIVLSVTCIVFGVPVMNRK